MTFDPDSSGTLGAARAAGSPATFLLALIAATLLHAAFIMLLTIKTPAPESGADSGTGTDSALQITIMSGEALDAAALPTAVPIAAESNRVAASTDIDSAIVEPLAPVVPVVPVAEDTRDTPNTVDTGDTGDTVPDASDESPAERPPKVDDAPPGEPLTELDVRTQPEPDPIAVEEIGVEPDRTSLPAEPLSSEDPMATGAPIIDAARILASRGAEIGRLVAEQDARSIANASRVRRKSISAGTHEFRYASYLSAWARKVERIGNLNYPQAARDQRMFGSLVLQVAVKSDGSLEQIRVVRSSGYDLLDEAAVRIVQLAAPFAPFPPDIAAETDVLDIVRTWQFLQGGRLGWEQP